MSEIQDVVIYQAERTRSSRNGNPGYRFHTSRGVYSMTTDASLGYAVDNFIWSEWRAKGSLFNPDDMVIGNPTDPRVTLVLDHNRDVSYIKRNGRVLS